MLTKEIAAGLTQWARRLDDAQRRARTGSNPDRVRYAAQCRRDAFKYLVMACGSLKAWPVTAQVGPEAVRAAHDILLAADGPEIRKVLPLVTFAAERHRIPILHLAEAIDALCVAERRPQVYGTVADHPVADEAKVRAKREALGLPSPTTEAAVLRTRLARPAEEIPAGPELCDGLDVLDGLLKELPPVRQLPRTVRRRIGPDEDWACAYCGGAASPGSAEIEVRRRIWRVCRVCAGCPDTPQARLLDVLLTKGGVPEATARATAELGRREGWRLPLRYEEPRVRPDRRPQPRWAHIPVSAVGKLVSFAEEHRPDPASDPAPVPASSRPADRAYPGMLVSPKAAALLALAPELALSAKEVGRALQLAPPTLTGRGLVVATVGELRAVFESPPEWLLAYHHRLIGQRTANRARQLGGVHRVPAPAAAPGAAPAASPANAPTAAATVPAQAARRRTGPAEPVLGPPHPEMLLSGRAEQVLARPPDTELAANIVSKALQTAHATIVKQRLKVTTVAELIAVFHRPPEWLLDFHRKLAAERAANLLRQGGVL
ncbi:hypothetical protein [Kitasatospora sp. NPDC057223]|uniref:hypothetical protein n=1 Tax=Kitasatospora sp. NPDC057223 TaxID=3346055 RepID=UPI00362B1C96